MNRLLALAGVALAPWLLTACRSTPPDSRAGASDSVTRVIRDDWVPPTTPEQLSGNLGTFTVNEVVRGDVLLCSLGGRQVRVKLYGAVCPEAHELGGAQAVAFTREFIAGKTVELRCRDLGSEAPQVCELLANNQSLSRGLLSAGHAWWDRATAPGDTAFKALADEARQAKRGMWR